MGRSSPKKQLPYNYGEKQPILMLGKHPFLILPIVYPEMCHCVLCASFALQACLTRYSYARFFFRPLVPKNSLFARDLIGQLLSWLNVNFSRSLKDTPLISKYLIPLDDYL